MSLKCTYDNNNYTLISCTLKQLIIKLSYYMISLHPIIEIIFKLTVHKFHSNYRRKMQ